PWRGGQRLRIGQPSASSVLSRGLVASTVTREGRPSAAIRLARTFASSSSRIDLPEPLTPTTATCSPWRCSVRNISRTSAQRARSGRGSGPNFPRLCLLVEVRLLLVRIGRHAGGAARGERAGDCAQRRPEGAGAREGGV